MRGLRMGTAGLMLAIVLAAPQPASAGMGEVIDVIIGLSGPRMWGFPIDCEFNLENGKRSCYVAGFRVPLNRDLNDRFLEERKKWVALGFALMGSTDKDSPLRAFEPWEAGLVAIEPTVNFRSYRHQRTNFFLEHGGGATVLYLFGDHFTPILKGGAKVRLFSATFRNIGGSGFDLGGAYNLRILFRGFTKADFDVAGPTTDGGWELAQGYSVTIGW